jgi:repressor LexA
MPPNFKRLSGIRFRINAPDWLTVMLSRLPRTQRQKEVFDYLVSFLERRGYIPTYTQIAKHLGVKSRATVAKHIQALVRLGLVTIIRKGNSSQIVINQEVMGPSDSLCEIPMAGFIAAGKPIELVPDGEMISVPRFMLGRVRPERVYAARIQGDSMIDEHICDGDIALIENRPEAHDGEIVVALVDEAYATLKRLYRHGAEVELRASNPQVESIRVPARNVRIQGIFRGLLRETRN